MKKTAWVTAAGDPVHLTVYEAGRGRPSLVFLHGLTARAGFYEDLVPGANFLAAMAEEGVNVVAPDLPGHGFSGGSRGHLTYRGAVAAGMRAVEFALELLGGPVAVGGSSLGGVLSLYLGVEDPRVRAVAALGALDLRDIGPVLLRFRQKLLVPVLGKVRRLAQAAPFPKVPAAAVISPRDVFEDPANLARWRSFPGITWWYTLASLVDLFLHPEGKPSLQALDKPALIATGEEDPIFPVTYELELASSLPYGEAFVLPGAGHMLPLEHLAATRKIMARWLKETL